MDEIVIEGFPKNRTTVVVGAINEYGGRVLVHVREMKAAVTEGGWVHGSGVAFDVERVWELADAVHRLADVAVLEKVVARLPVGRDEIRVGVQPWKGEQYAYVRRFYPDGDGGWLPSPKGVNVKTAFVDDLIQLVDNLASEVVARGLASGREAGNG